MITWMTRQSIGKTMKDMHETELVTGLEDTKYIFDVVTGMEIPDNPKEPVYKMWNGHEFALGIYGMMMPMELTMNRNIADKTFWHFKHAIDEMKLAFLAEGLAWGYVPPAWFRDLDVLRSHRSNLARRRPDKYGEKWPKIQEDMPYLWPIVDDEGEYKIMMSKADKELLAAGELFLTPEQMERVANL